jgi:hypothetical protein
VSDTFSFRSTKSGEVHISWQGKPVTTLRGGTAARFLGRARLLDDDGVQLLMARVTGNFKRGNER